MDFTYKEKFDFSTPSGAVNRKYKDDLVYETSLTHNLFLVYFVNFIYKLLYKITFLNISHARETDMLRPDMSVGISG
jgi:hypothetical protein